MLRRPGTDHYPDVMTEPPVRLGWQVISEISGTNASFPAMDDGPRSDSGVHSSCSNLCQTKKSTFSGVQQYRHLSEIIFTPKTSLSTPGCRGNWRAVLASSCLTGCSQKIYSLTSHVSEGEMAARSSAGLCMSTSRMSTWCRTYS